VVKNKDGSYSILNVVEQMNMQHVDDNAFTERI
jgi:hypothetical protein